MTKISPRNFGGKCNKVKLKRRGRKPRTSFYQEPENSPEFQPSTQEWKEIEGSYGHLIPDNLRTEIIHIVDDYLWSVECEKNKCYAIEAIAYLERITKAISPSAMLMKTPKKPSHRAAREVLLDYYLFDEASPMDRINPESFLKIPDKVAMAAIELVDDISAQDLMQNKTKPIEWDKMVVRLMIALGKNGLPYTVNKRGTLKGASPVTSLLHEIQDRIPAEWRLHVGHDRESTDETMAAAASAAWVTYKRSPEGKFALREQAKGEQAKSEDKDYGPPGRDERLNKIFKYLQNLHHRRLSKSSIDQVSLKIMS